MAGYGYQQKGGSTARTARARLAGLNASYKDLSNVCANVRGWATEDALDFLAKAAEGKRAVLFRTHCKHKGHRRELGGRKGGWPVKSAKFVLEAVRNALANATRLGLGQTRIAHILANKQNTYPRLSPKGRRIRHDYETAFVEVVLEETQQKAQSKQNAQKADKGKSEVQKPQEA
ncbi:MAG: 50S ribosomal protein L22 [Candidatus Micrarchaeota archaeon]|nr:50S ribosomal protein L22 [Candidatus Micrarchaeota archaeon]